MRSNDKKASKATCVKRGREGKLYVFSDTSQQLLSKTMLELRSLASEAMAVLRSEPQYAARSGISCETLNIQDDIVCLMECCYEVLGDKMPRNPFSAGDMMLAEVDRRFSAAEHK